jgi:hypothetical protein
MEIWEGRQNNPVADEVSALVAVTGSVIAGVLRSLSATAPSAIGGRDGLPLRLLGRVRKETDGDCGIAFEYAVHEAVISRVPAVIERITDALGTCGIPGDDPASILFGIEKSGSQRLISTEPGLVTANSPALLGEGGQLVGLREHLSAMGDAFRRADARPSPAQSIRGRWKSGLFLGSARADRWVAASVSLGQSEPRPAQSEPRAAPGPRIEIVPGAAGPSDAVRLDEHDAGTICPVPLDGGFLRVFHQGWRIVQALCARDFELPSPDDLPGPAHREVARIFAERRDFPVADVVAATEKFAQPGLLTISREVVPDVPFATTTAPATSTIITPIPHLSGTSPRSTLDRADGPGELQLRG